MLGRFSAPDNGVIFPGINAFILCLPGRNCLYLENIWRHSHKQRRTGALVSPFAGSKKGAGRQRKDSYSGFISHTVGLVEDKVKKYYFCS